MVAQSLYNRNAGQRLTSGRAGAKQLPARLQSAKPHVRESSFRQTFRLVTTVMRLCQARRRLPWRTAPEWKGTARNPSVELRCDVEPVVRVVWTVLETRGDFVPYGAPSRS